MRATTAKLGVGMASLGARPTATGSMASGEAGKVPPHGSDGDSAAANMPYAPPGEGPPTGSVKGHRGAPGVPGVTHGTPWDG